MIYFIGAYEASILPLGVWNGLKIKEEKFLLTERKIPRCNNFRKREKPNNVFKITAHWNRFYVMHTIVRISENKVNHRIGLIYLKQLIIWLTCLFSLKSRASIYMLWMLSFKKRKMNSNTTKLNRLIQATNR